MFAAWASSADERPLLRDSLEAIDRGLGGPAGAGCGGHSFTHFAVSE